MVADVVDDLGIKGTSSRFLINRQPCKTTIPALDYLEGDLIGA